MSSFGAKMERQRGHLAHKVVARLPKTGTVGQAERFSDLLEIIEAKSRGAPERALFELFEAVKQIQYPSLVLKEASYLLQCSS